MSPALPLALQEPGRALAVAATPAQVRQAAGMVLASCKHDVPADAIEKWTDVFEAVVGSHPPTVMRAAALALARKSRFSITLADYCDEIVRAYLDAACPPTAFVMR